jgi:triosephosphate isomerase
MRQKQIIGNWKMHGTLAMAKQYLDILLAKDLLAEKDKKIRIAPPFPLLAYMAKRVEGSLISIGAQNVSEEKEGAFTGEVSASMLQDVGASFVLIGHSERRRLFHETSEQIQKKILQALAAGLLPIICIGETEEERKQGLAKKILEKQIQGALQNISTQDIVFAYEPVWAIGTGQNASPEIAEEIHCFCRNVLQEIFGSGAQQIPIVYGGSVKETNAASFLAKENVDGVLVGGASLDPEGFFQIIQSS